jgi:antitoxin MazE
MNSIIRSRLVKIGNSRGVRIPKPLLEQAGLENEVEMLVKGDQLIIQSPHKPRQGWEAQFARMAENKDDQLLDEPTSTQWDTTEWTW